MTTPLRRNTPLQAGEDSPTIDRADICARPVRILTRARGAESGASRYAFAPMVT